MTLLFHIFYSNICTPIHSFLLSTTNLNDKVARVVLLTQFCPRTQVNKNLLIIKVNIYQMTLTNF